MWASENRGRRGTARRTVAAAGKERRPAVLRNFDISYIGVCAPQIWIYCIAHRATGPSARSRLGSAFVFALSATMAVVMMLVLRGCVPSLRRLAWPLAVVQGLASVALVVPLLPASPSASIFYAVAAALAGAGVAWLYLQWAPFFASSGAKDVIACVFIAGGRFRVEGAPRYAAGSRCRPSCWRCFRPSRWPSRAAPMPAPCPQGARRACSTR